MVGVKAASNSSASSSTSSVSSGVTSTVQRTRHIPISIASTKKTTTTTSSPQLKRPSPKQTTVRVQMSEFSVDFGDGDAKKKSESPGTSKKPLSTEKKTPPLEKKLPVSGLRRPSNTSIGSNGSTGSGKASADKKPPSLDKSVTSDKKSISSDKKPPSKSVSGEKATPERRPSTSSNGSDKKSVSDRSNQKVLAKSPSTKSNGSQPKSTSSDKPTTSADNKSKSTTPQRVVVADVHRAADLQVEEVNDEKSREEEYRNSQTSDSVVVDDTEKKEVTEKVLETKNEDNEEVLEKVEKKNEEVLEKVETKNEEQKTPVAEEKQETPEPNSFPVEIQTPKIIDQEVVEQEAEISVDVAERKEEEGQITTKILLDGENRAVAARDLEIEIRREVHTEVSPPITPEPPRLSEDEGVKKVDKLEEIKSQSEPKQQEDPIKPFVFKESKSETPQHYKDVSVRVESVEKESHPLKENEFDEKEPELDKVEKVQVTVIEEVKFQDDKNESVPDKIDVADKKEEIKTKSATPMEEVNLNIEERKKSDADLAEVRVYRERYSEAPILPYPQATSVQQEKTPRIDLSNLRPKDETTIKKRPLITPIERKEDQSPMASPKQDPRPRIISQELKEVDEEIERLKREPIRLNIASSIHSPPATSPPSPSQYENKQVEKQNGTPQHPYPSNLDINGLYKPHPLYPKQDAADTPLEQSTTKLTTTTTLISTTVNENGNASPSDRLIISPSPSGRLSTGTGERSDNDFTPRTLSRIKHLNVIMEGGSEKDVGEVIHHHPIFMRDTSKYWYKPTISREEAIAMLKDKEPGTFVVRDSNSFPGAFGLALKVSQPPAGVQPGDGTELVRHFLIEPSAKGVKLKGCSNEPVFGTLAALIYQHSITPLALPAKLLLPDGDPATTPEHLNANQALLERGAACNVTYICSLDTESLTGPEAVRRAVLQGLQLLQQRALRAVPVHFKVSSQGITLTDNTRTLFFRRHYPVTTVTFAGIDPESRLFDNNNAQQLPPTYIRQAPMFGFVARKSPSSPDNSCHVFAELDPEQPASAVVRFITNVMLVYARAQQQQIHRAVAGV